MDKKKAQVLLRAAFIAGQNLGQTEAKFMGDEDYVELEIGYRNLETWLASFHIDLDTIDLLTTQKITEEEWKTQK